ncbi:hypothetical protein RB601_003375 [Gaeumannomyces tritici]
MSSIGPQMPPHLSKRKRDDHDATAPQPPPPKTSRRAGAGATNDDEIALDWGDNDDSDDSDDDTGPAAPPPKTAAPPPATAARPDAPPPGPRRPSPAPAPRAAVGPSMPPSRAPANGGDCDGGTGPTAPPAQRPQPTAAPRPVMGPAAPPADLSERPSEDPKSDSDDSYGPRQGPPEGEEQDGSDDDDDDDDDDYGPAPADSRAARRNEERHRRKDPVHMAGVGYARRKHDGALVEQEERPKVQRDEWMVVPPPPTEARDADPTKIRARGFATGRAAAAASVNSNQGLGSMWVETAQQRAERVLSRATADIVDERTGGGRLLKGESDETREAAIRLYTEQTRGRSMYEEHQAALKEGKRPGGGGDAKKGKAKEEEDDPSKRAFDRDKDMAVGGRITGAQRRDLMKQAADFGGRFQAGKYL